MKLRYRLFGKHSGVFFVEDRISRQLAYFRTHRDRGWTITSPKGAASFW